LDAIASPRRREILRLVWGAEQTAGAIHRAMPDVTFGAVSLQLRSLLEAGLLEVRTEQRNRFYRARPEALGPTAEILERM
jgi:DNA-binding transcriptional ArsR family regulator